MADSNQLSFGDVLLSSRHKISKLSNHLATLDQIIDWQPLDQEIPDFTTFWGFKEALNTHNLDERIFQLIGEQLEAKA